MFILKNTYNASEADYYGPFNSYKEANDWAEQHLLNFGDLVHLEPQCGWVIIQLQEV